MGREAVDRAVREAASRDEIAAAVRYTLQLLAERSSGNTLEVRVPPFGAVQCIGTAMLLIVICGAGEVLFRERHPQHLAIPRLWTKKSLASKRVFISLILGYALVPLGALVAMPAAAAGATLLARHALGESDQPAARAPLPRA